MLRWHTELDVIYLELNAATDAVSLKGLKMMLENALLSCKSSCVEKRKKKIYRLTKNCNGQFREQALTFLKWDFSPDYYAVWLTWNITVQQL